MREVEESDNMHLGGEDRNIWKAVRWTAITYRGMQDMKQVNSEPGEPDHYYCLPLVKEFVIKQQLSGLALKDLLELFNVLIPGVLPESKYYIDKEFLYLFEQFVNSNNLCGNQCSDEE